MRNTNLNTFLGKEGYATKESLKLSIKIILLKRFYHLYLNGISAAREKLPNVSRID